MLPLLRLDIDTQDIAKENILMNTLGVEHNDRQYNDRHLADLYTGRPTKAPEIDLKRPYDAFAPDVTKRDRYCCHCAGFPFLWQSY
jgi:hypothetical protein